MKTDHQSVFFGLVTFQGHCCMYVSYRLSWKEVVMPAVDLAKKTLLNVSNPTGVYPTHIGIVTSQKLVLIVNKQSSRCWRVKSGVTLP